MRFYNPAFPFIPPLSGKRQDKGLTLWGTVPHFGDMAKLPKIGRPPLPAAKRRVAIGARITPEAYAALLPLLKPKGAKLGDVLSAIIVSR